MKNRVALLVGASSEIGQELLQVYTKDSCPTVTGPILGIPDKKLSKTRFNGNFSCEVSEGALFELYVMYEGVCKVK